MVNQVGSLTVPSQAVECLGHSVHILSTSAFDYVAFFRFFQNINGRQPLLCRR